MTVRRSVRRHACLAAAGTLLLAACGSDDDGASSADNGSIDTSSAGESTTSDATASSNGTAPSTDAELTEVDSLNVSVGSAFIGYTAWWIADGAGLFEEHGVDVNVTTYEGAATSMASLAAEQIDVMANSVGLGMTGTAQGLDVKFIYGLSDFNYLSMSIVGRTGIETIDDLAAMGGDCTIAVTVPGSAPLGFTNQFVEQYGIECDRVVANSMPAVLSMVASGQADAATVFPSQATTAKADGQVTILYDAFTATPEEGEQMIPNSFLFGGMITSGGVIESKRESLVRMLAALDEANAMIEELSAEELAEITKQVAEPWLATPVEVVAQQWELAKGAVHDGEVTEEQWMAALEGFSSDFESAAIDPDDPAQGYDQAVDMTVLAEARDDE